VKKRPRTALMAARLSRMTGERASGRLREGGRGAEEHHRGDEKTAPWRRMATLLTGLANDIQAM